LERCRTTHGASYEGDWLNGDLELDRLWYSTLDKTYGRRRAKKNPHWLSLTVATERNG